MKFTKTKYPSIYKDENGRINYYANLGTDPITGKRVQKRRYKDQNGNSFNNEKSAFIELNRVKREFEKSTAVNDNKLTYADYMKRVYLPFYTSNVKPQTWSSRAPMLKKLVERFGTKKLRDINARDAEQFRIYLLNESGYSQSYSSLIYNSFRRTLDYAVSMQYLDVNQTKRTKAISKPNVKVEFWTKADFEKVIGTFYLSDYHEHMNFIMIWVYFMTGIRVSEGLALTWDDVDLGNSLLTISHSLNRTAGGKYELYSDTKTVNGRRTISIDVNTVQYLKEWQIIQAKHGASQLIMSENDEPLWRSTVQRVIARHAKLAGVKRIQGKGLRHSHVSYLINEFNADVLLVSRRLGHSDPSITLKHYSHMWPMKDRQITKLMENNINVKFTDKSLYEFNGNKSSKIS